MTLRTIQGQDGINDDTGADLFGADYQQQGNPQPDSTTAIQLNAEEIQQTLSDLHLELTMSQSQREGHVTLAREYERVYRMVDYDKSELLKPEAKSIRTPLTTSRINKAYGSMFGALGIDPFIDCEIPSGSTDGPAALHVAAALNEEWRRADATSFVGISIRNDLTHSIGYLKAVAIQDADDGDSASIEVSAPDMQDMWLMPHRVRNLARCSLVGERSRWTILEVKRYSDTGFFDKEQVMLLRPTNTDWNGKSDEVNNEFHDLEDNTSFNDSGEVEIFEIYARKRNKADDGEETWRYYVCMQQRILLRAESWEDGIPYFPIRHDKVSNTIYSTPFPALTKDIQYSMDMLFSAALETDRMAISPVFAVPPMSEAWQWVEESMERGESGISPGDVLPISKDQLGVIQFAPVPMELMNRFNQLQQFADTSTIPSLPTQTVRAATEIRYVVGELQAQEQQMLKALRDDLKNFLEYFKRLYWKYIATADLVDINLGGNDENGDLNPLDPSLSEKYVIHDTQAYKVKEAVYKGIRVIPRGMTTKADQVMQQQSQTVLAKIISPMLMQQKAMQQAGIWAGQWEILRRLCEANDIQDYERIIGPNPTQDPNLISLSGNSDPAESNQAMMGMQLAQMNMGTGGGNPLEQGGQRGDGAQTSSPGFAQANDQGVQGSLQNQ